jgi:hypothetical protein
MDLWALLVIAPVAIWLSLGIRIANEDERLATFVLGRFAGLKGPGLVIMLPGASPEYVRVRLGMEGETQSYELASFEGRAIPFTTEKSVKPGSEVRIKGFERDATRLEAIPRVVVCEKCGHKNPL